MRTILLATFVIVFLLFTSSQKAEAGRVSGYYNNRGTYVQPYYRTPPNSYRGDNYSSRGNINPYNGRRGYSPW